MIIDEYVWRMCVRVRRRAMHAARNSSQEAHE